MWQCPKCKREFSKQNQSRSCVVYPLERHFQNRDYSKKLFKKLVTQIEKSIGDVKIESLPCCNHLVSNYTFSGIWILKYKIRINFQITFQK